MQKTTTRWYVGIEEYLGRDKQLSLRMDQLRVKDATFSNCLSVVRAPIPPLNWFRFGGGVPLARRKSGTSLFGVFQSPH